MKTELLGIVPVIPTSDMERTIKWYSEKAGFDCIFGDHMYAGLRRSNIDLHLQWHADTEDDPLLGGSVVRIFVEDIQHFFDEFVARRTVSKDKLRRNTPWGTHEFGFYDLNQNAIFIVEDVSLQ